MKRRGNILIGITLAAALMLVSVGCRKQVQPTADTMPRVLFEASVGNTEIQQGRSSKLTPSTSDALGAGRFETGDKVGLFLFDQNGAGSYSFVNEPYTADADVKFIPSQTVFYKTYYNHNVYAYFPHADANTNASAIAVSIKQDQSQMTDYMSCDFLSTHLSDVKPQQINPNAPELKMNFDHQMTSVVVTIKNADGSPIRPIPVIKILNTKTDAQIDITKAKPVITFTDVAKAVKMMQNSAKTIVTSSNETLFYEAIVMPQTLTKDVILLFIQIGEGQSARTFEYKAKEGDPILTNGLAQGMEHIFNLTLSGTELTVQGGEIVPWGTGTALNQTISGGGVVTSKMNLEMTGDANLIKALGDKIVSAAITIDGNEYKAEAKFDGANLLTLNYKVTDWQFDMENIKLLDADGNVAIIIPSFTKMRIIGNPTDPTYNKVIATIDAQSGVVTKK